MSLHKNKTALITGATGGIGAEFCRLFALDRVNLVLVARNEKKLNQLSQQLQREFDIDVLTIALDLAMPNAAQQLYKKLQDKGLKLDFLINNAGTGQYGEFATADINTLTNMLNLNITAVVQLTRLILPELLQQGNGHILNVASLVAFQPGGVKAAAYYASKNFVLTFNRALALELKKTPISSTVFCPGPLSTNFAEQGGFATTRLYRYFSGNLNRQVKNAYRGMMKGKPTVVSGFVNHVLAFAGELPPRNIALVVNRFLLN